MVSCLAWLSPRIKYTLGHILVFIFNSFFSIRIPGYFQEFGKRHLQVLIHSMRNFRKKNPKFRIPRTLATENHKPTCLILALVCTPSLCSRSLWMENSRKECRNSHSHNLVSCNSCSRISLNAPDESVQLVLQKFLMKKS